MTVSDEAARYHFTDIKLDDRLVVRTPLVAREAVAEAGFFSRFFEGIAIFFRELVT